MYDEPLALSGAARRHYTGCVDCQARFQTVTEDARQAAVLLVAPAAEFDAARALGRLRPAPVPVTVRARLAPRWGRLWRPLVAVAAAAALVGLLFVTGVGDAAIKIFEPTQVQPVPIPGGAIESTGSLPNLDAYGTTKWTSQPSLHMAAAAATAAADSGLPLLSPTLPASVSGLPVTYGVMNQATGSFTFSAAKAEAAAAKQGKTLPPMPAGMDGSTLYVTIGPAVAQIYGNLGTGKEGQPNPNALPKLVVGEMRVPVVTSTGVTVQQLKDYLLAQPGVSPQLAAAIRSIGDPTTTLPIPYPADLATAHPVTLRGGVQGVAIGDNTGLGYAVIWIKNGLVFGVAGSLSEGEVLGIANSLS